MKPIQLLLSTSYAAFCAFTPAWAATPAPITAPNPYVTLAQRRIQNPEAVTPIPFVNGQPVPYTTAERTLVLDQTEMFLRDLYVHLYLKEGKDQAEEAAPPVKDSPHFDPLKQIASVRANLDRLSDPEFHAQMSQAFLGVRDLHTNYYYPKPYACYTNALPFAVDKVIDPKTGAYVAGISAITNTSEILALSPGIEQIEAGDILESYEGLRPSEDLVALDLKELGAGANRAAYERRAYERLSMRPQELDPLPASSADHPDQIKITVRKRIVAPGKPSRVTLILPWISFYTDPTCLGLPADPSLPAPKGFPWIDPPASASDDFGRQFARLYSRHSAKPNAHAKTDAVSDPLMNLSDLSATADPSLFYKVLKSGTQTYGYLNLTSFDPALDEQSSLTIIQNLLTHELAATNGLIIDVRDNHGGEIEYGEKMIQYFTAAKVVTEDFRLRATTANTQFLQACQTEPWASWLGLDYATVEKNITTAQADPAKPIYADAGVITATQDANSVGQLYFKPVTILTNSNCFSTCDMFTAGMQDNGAAEIWAEDGQTGGGGANVMAESDFIAMIEPNTTLYSPLPHGQDFRIAWRQAVRVLSHAGQLVEGQGVSADHGTRKEGSHFLLPSSPDDLALDNQLTMRTLVDSLAARASQGAPPTPAPSK